MPDSQVSLKDKNRLPLLSVLMANVFTFYFVLNLEKLLSEDIVSALSNNWTSLLPLGGAFMVTTLLNGLLPSDFKGKIVFWRWTDPLPSRAAFSDYAKKDQRVDFSVIEQRFSPLPSTAKEQSTLWYRIYRDFRSDPSITQVHQDYLFMRDWCGFSLIALIVFGVFGAIVVDSGKIIALYYLVLLAQYLVTMIAARNYGTRMVKNVLALESSKNTP